jgi:hypothetical protein
MRENAEIRMGEDYRVRVWQFPAVIRVRQVDQDPTFGTLVTYRFVGESGATFGSERCWPIAWFQDFEIPIPLLHRAAQTECLQTELNRDSLDGWWRGLQGSRAVPLWIVREDRGNAYQG